MRRIAYREKIRNLLVFVQDTTCFVTGGTGVLFCSVRMLLTFDRLRARERRGETEGERENETARERREREREKERKEHQWKDVRSDQITSDQIQTQFLNPKKEKNEN